MYVRNFRLFAFGQVVSAAGTWMMVVAQDWSVLSLTDNSPTALGLVTALQFTPVLLLALYGGRLADRHDKRTLLIAANLVCGMLAALLAPLMLTGALRLWHLYLFALGLGTASAVEIPTRMSFVREMVGPELLPNASALSAAYFNIARVAGPAVGGLLVGGFGTGPVVLLNAVSYLATVVALRMMRPAELHRGPPGAARARVVDGLRYTVGRPDLLYPLALVAAVGLLGFNFQLTLPLVAKTVFHTSAASFGLLTTALAAGSLLAALVTTSRTTRPSGRLVTGSALAFGIAETAAGWAPTYLSEMLLLAVTGFTTLYFAQAANHRIQLGADPAFSGRVLAIYALILQGTTPLGALLVGRLTAHWGARSGLYAGGIGSLAAAALVMLLDRPGSAGARRPATGADAADAAHAVDAADAACVTEAMDAVPEPAGGPDPARP
ncbi:MFS transporter [Actinacidiphila alni]